MLQLFHKVCMRNITKPGKTGTAPGQTVVTPGRTVINLLQTGSQRGDTAAHVCMTV